jgi:hypothetical protein
MITKITTQEVSLVGTGLFFRKAVNSICEATSQVFQTNNGRNPFSILRYGTLDTYRYGLPYKISICAKNA